MLRLRRRSMMVECTVGDETRSSLKHHASWWPPPALRSSSGAHVCCQLSRAAFDTERVTCLFHRGNDRRSVRTASATLVMHGKPSARWCSHRGSRLLGVAGLRARGWSRFTCTRPRLCCGSSDVWYQASATGLTSFDDGHFDVCGANMGPVSAPHHTARHSGSVGRVMMSPSTPDVCVGRCTRLVLAPV